MKNIISLYAGHNASITIKDKTGKYRVIEFDRLFQEKHSMLYYLSENELLYRIICVLDLLREKYEVDTNFDTLCLGVDGQRRIDVFREIINPKSIHFYDHHKSHAASSFYQSPFQKALIISYDGGGNDGSFNIYIADKTTNEIDHIDSININLGDKYLITGYPISEITGLKHQLPQDLEISGKLMGLAAYGNIRSDWIIPLTKFYKTPGRSLDKLSKEINLNLETNALTGQNSCDFAATSQKVFENIFFEATKIYIEKYDLPICLAGGSALNILVNEKLRQNIKREIFIPPNPDDGGLSLGQHFLCSAPKSQVDITYCGIPILDEHKLKYYIKKRKPKKITLEELADLIIEGKIIGIIQSNCEVGPRALGNRSIICNPSIKGMKDILNKKVKHRESYRPFAPVTRLNDAHKFFEVSKNELGSFKFMSYSPKVKQEYQEKLKEVVHKDNTSRLQIVDKTDKTIFYKLLTELSKKTDMPVLLNTSFNIKGRPIISAIQDALEVLDTTQLDAFYAFGYLFTKNK